MRCFRSLQFILLMVGLVGFGCGGGGGETSIVTPPTGLSALSGQVFSESTVFLAGAMGKVGQPNARVTLEATGYTTLSDAAGNFSISGVEPGTYWVLVEWVNPQTGQKHANRHRVQLRAGITEPLPPVIVTPTGTIRGRVQLSDSGDPTGVAVYVPGSTFAARAASDGTFLLDDLAEGTYAIASAHPGYVTTGLPAVVVESDGVTDVGLLELQAVVTPVTEARLLGTVRTTGGVPIVGAVLLCQNRAVETNDVGAYGIGGLAEGSHRVVCVKEGFVHWETTIVLVEGDNGLNPSLVPLAQTVAQLAGTVKDPSGAAIASASLRLDPPVQTAQISGGDGSWTFVDLPAGAYALHCQAAGFNDKTVFVALAGGGNLNLPLTLTPMLSNSAPSLTLSGPGQAEAGATVTLSASGSDPDGDVLTYTWTVAEGSLDRSTGQQVRWTLPATAGSRTARCLVDDGTGAGNATASAELTVTVLDPGTTLYDFTIWGQANCVRLDPAATPGDLGVAIGGAVDLVAASSTLSGLPAYETACLVYHHDAELGRYRSRVLRVGSPLSANLGHIDSTNFFVFVLDRLISDNGGSLSFSVRDGATSRWSSSVGAVAQCLDLSPAVTMPAGVTLPAGDYLARVDGWISNLPGHEGDRLLLYHLTPTGQMAFRILRRGEVETLSMGNCDVNSFFAFVLDGYVADNSGCLTLSLEALGTTAPANEAPTVTVQGPERVSPNATVRFEALASDGDDDPLSYAWTCSAGTLSATDTREVLWTAPATETSCSLSCQVSDGTAIARDTRTLEIEARPVFDLTVDGVGHCLSVTPAKTPAPEIYLSGGTGTIRVENVGLAGLPSGDTAVFCAYVNTSGDRVPLVLRPGTPQTLTAPFLDGVTFWTFVLDGYTLDNGGTATVRVQDGTGELWASSLSASVNVLNLGRAAVPGGTIPAGSYRATVTGQISGLPANDNESLLIFHRTVLGTMDLIRVEVGTPVDLTLPAVDSTSFFAFVLDGVIGDNGGSLNLHLEPIDPNQTPTVTVSGATVVGTGGSLGLTAEASDPDGDALTYTWTCTAGSFVANGTPSVSWNAPAAAGTVTLDCEVDDGGRTAHHAIEVEVVAGGTETAVFQVHAVNQCLSLIPAATVAAPGLTVNGTATIYGENATLTNLPSNRNAEALLYYYDAGLGRMATAIVDATGRSLQLADIHGANFFAFLLDGYTSDNGGQIALRLDDGSSDVWTAVLGGVSHVVNLGKAAVPTSSISAGSYLATVSGATSGLPNHENDRLLVYHRRPDGSMALRILRVGNPQILDLPNVDATSFFAFVLDGYLADNSGTLTLSLQAYTPPVEHAPVVSVSGPALALPASTVTFSATASDEDGDDLSYAWTASSGTLLSQNGPVVQWTAPASSVTTAEITCTVSDGGLDGIDSIEVGITGDPAASLVVNAVTNCLNVGGAVSEGGVGLTVQSTCTVTVENATLAGLPSNDNTSVLLYYYDRDLSAMRAMAVRQGTNETISVDSISTVSFWAFVLDGYLTDNSGTAAVRLFDGTGDRWNGNVSATSNALNLNAAATPATALPAGRYLLSVEGSASGLPNYEGDRVLVYHRNLLGTMDLRIVRVGDPVVLDLPALDSTSLFAFVLDGYTADNSGSLTLHLSRGADGGDPMTADEQACVDAFKAFVTDTESFINGASSWTRAVSPTFRHLGYTATEYRDLLNGLLTSGDMGGAAASFGVNGLNDLAVTAHVTGEEASFVSDPVRYTFTGAVAPTSRSGVMNFLLPNSLRAQKESGVWRITGDEAPIDHFEVTKLRVTYQYDTSSWAFTLGGDVNSTTAAAATSAGIIGPYLANPSYGVDLITCAGPGSAGIDLPDDGGTPPEFGNTILLDTVDSQGEAEALDGASYTVQAETGEGFWSRVKTLAPLFPTWGATAPTFTVTGLSTSGCTVTLDNASTVKAEFDANGFANVKLSACSFPGGAEAEIPDLDPALIFDGASFDLTFASAASSGDTVVVEVHFRDANENRLSARKVMTLP